MATTHVAPSHHISTSPPPLRPNNIPGDLTDPLLVYLLKLTQGHVPAKKAIISAIKACTDTSDTRLGKAIHAHVVKIGLKSDRFVGTSLVQFYANGSHLASAEQVFDDITEKDMALQTAMLVGFARNGSTGRARRVFDGMANKDVLAWNAMLTGYAQQGLPQEALQLFRDMQIAGFKPTDVTLVGALSACSQLGCLSVGEWIHGHIEGELPHALVTPTLINSLVYMYAKCGRLDAAFHVFLHKGPQNLESWNTMMTSFAIHGSVTNAFSLFSQMIKKGLTPDRITFMALLMACSHGGLVDHAWSCINCMQHKYNMEPRAEHYGCMVDVLSRSGHLEEACELIQSMPYEPDAHVLGALLGGCQTHGQHELGVRVAKRLIEMGPEEEGRYIALANLCVMEGRIDDAMEARKIMAEMGVEPSPGSSLIEIDGVVHEFLAGDPFS